MQRRLDAVIGQNGLYATAIEHLAHGLSMFDADDRLLLANRRYLEIWGLPGHLGRPGTHFTDIMAATRGVEVPRDDPADAAPADPRKAGQRRREWQMDDGRVIEVTVARLDGGACVALHEDITEQRRAERQIAHLARHDALTGLPNRATLRDALERNLPRTLRGEVVAVMCLDLDRFKAVNDTLGHAAGDTLLQQVAGRLRERMRAGDIVARLGGDEFAIVQFGAAQPAGSTALGHRLVEAIGLAFDLGGQQVHVGTSIGIAIAPLDGDHPDELLRCADLALYRAKADGRGTLRYFEPEMDAVMQARRQLEQDLRHALARHEFELAYQPVVVLPAHTIDGVEALIRWNHPSRGRVSPDDFITLAEDTGLIVPIGRWVLQQACRDAVVWPEHVSVAVNLSPVQFRSRSLLSDVLQALGDSGLDPRRLQLEITESVMLHDTEHSLALLHDLRERGIRIAMDDFGTGYSSLSHLRRFPFDKIKIDRSFVHEVGTRHDALAIIRAVTGLGHSLGMATTVEGVETAEQLAAVRREGCSEVQGFLFSRPRPAREIAGLILDGAMVRDTEPATSPG